MTTTTEPSTATACPPSAVVDQIARWEDVQPGDLVLDKGEFVLARERDDSYSEPAYVGFFIGEYWGGLERWMWRRRDHYTAVRRYTEGISDRDALVIAALDEAAADRDARAHEYCVPCGESAVGMCPEHQGHLDRASEYRAERERLEAGR